MREIDTVTHKAAELCGSESSSMVPVPRMSQRWCSAFSMAVVLSLWGHLTSYAAELPLVAWHGRTMGSPYTIQIAGTNLAQAQIEDLRAKMEQTLTEVNRQMSHYVPESELSRFNRTPTCSPFKVSPAFARVTRFALEMSRRSAGAFDPTLGPLINLWGFGEQGERLAVPSEADLEEARKIVGAKRIAVTEQDELIKEIPELSLNLSGVAKGFGVDELVRVLVRHGFTNSYVAIAGEVRVLGLNARGTKWRIGISVPVSHWRESDPFAGVASLSNQAISTSGDYQKFFTDAQGKRLSHIIDPRTGWPVRHNLGGVTVVGPDSMTADALATTLFVLGCEEGLKFVEKWPNAAALFIVREPGDSFRQVASSRFAELTGYQPE